MENLQHWHVKVDEQKIAWWYLDQKNTSANTLHSDVLVELNLLIDQVNVNPLWRGIIIASNKKSGFILGANINQFTPETAVDLLKQGQATFNKLENLLIPTVAMIDGYCLGGGFELSLACTYRVAEESRKTKIGLPEIMLGFMPGWGGTVRLAKLIGAITALPLILSGKQVDGKTAYRLGMVDAAVPARQLARAASYFIINRPPKRSLSFMQKIIEQPWLRPLIGKLIKYQTAKKAKAEHYPAPFAVINKWVQYGSTEAGMKAEITEINKLMPQPTTANLIRIFLLRDKLNNFAKGTHFKAQRIVVIGAGLMGGDIAAYCSLRGLTVTLIDRDYQYVAPAIKRAYNLYKSIFKNDRLSIQAAMDRLHPYVDTQGIEGKKSAIANADVIIEAIIENTSAKQTLFNQIEQWAKPEAILATNTSSIPLADIAQTMQNPDRLVGIHFFNPVAKLPLVEVVHDINTTLEVQKKALAFVKQIGKLPLPVTSTPGFLVNRILLPYMMEAMKLYQEGVAPEVIDRAALDYGMPMGPIELADTVGLDVCSSVMEHLYGKDGTGMKFLQQKIQRKELGKKTGRGFYNYKNGKPKKAKVKTSVDANITDRLILRMVNESMACLRERVVESSDALDAGMIFGTGFAPFRGGPLRYAESVGYGIIATKLNALASQYGERFTPDAGWTLQLAVLPHTDEENNDRSIHHEV